MSPSVGRPILDSQLAHWVTRISNIRIAAPFSKRSMERAVNQKDKLKLRKLTLLKGFIGTYSSMGCKMTSMCGKMTLQTKTESGYPCEG